MSNTKFTPGPWPIEFDDDPGNFGLAVALFLAAYIFGMVLYVEWRDRRRHGTR